MNPSRYFTFPRDSSNYHEHQHSKSLLHAPASTGPCDDAGAYVISAQRYPGIYLVISTSISITQTSSEPANRKQRPLGINCIGNIGIVSAVTREVYTSAGIPYCCSSPELRSFLHAGLRSAMSLDISFYICLSSECAAQVSVLTQRSKYLLD